VFTSVCAKGATAGPTSNLESVDSYSGAYSVYSVYSVYIVYSVYTVLSSSLCVYIGLFTQSILLVCERRRLSSYIVYSSSG
jgi:hypothetical protein